MIRMIWRLRVYLASYQYGWRSCWHLLAPVYPNRIARFFILASAAIFWLAPR